ncbi:MAG TPA: 2-oxoglutarate dehydrogenase, E2 component, dihydrolipoamide succinyltransferase [Actinomycetota bacterium]|nr:2-oxoglutarate dehydrogenase, E2 component, dihydrolipoamide succinyltransferase [Actinomycetota bacterium]
MPPFKMPQLGETVIEGTITRWLKQEGETVEADEPLVEVSTDKVDSEIPAPASGVLNKIVAQEGETVAVGSVIAEIGEAGESSGEASEKESEPAAKSEEAQTKEPDVEEETKASEPPKEPAEQPAVAAAAVSATPQSTSQTEQEPRRGILSPLVRKLAAEHNVDLESIRGTGTGGRITKQDIMAAVESGTAKAPAAQAAPSQPADAEPESAPAPRGAAGGEEVVRITPMRKSIAEHMVASLRETARAWNTIEIDMTKIAQLRAQAGPAFKQREGFSLTWMPFVSKAVTQVLQKYPQVNSTWNGDGTITVKRYVNLGVAVALENGLIVPVVKGADGMNIAGLARAVRDVADRARKKKLVPDEVQGGTFTITNPGPFGSILSLPIINKGQSAILAFDAVIKRPVVVTDEMGNDSIAIRQMVFLSLSWDHRVIDGAEAAMFLADLKALLEDADFESDLAGYLPTPKT